MPSISRRSLFLLALCALALVAALILWLRPAWLVTATGWDEERWQLISFFTVVVCGTVALVVVLWGVLTYHLKPTEFSQKKDIVQLIAEILGGATLIITLFSTWQGVRENEAKLNQSMEIAQLTLNEARQRQQAERYSRAADQLGREDRGPRIAAIYALGQLASDSDEFYWPSIQMLVSYVAANAAWKGEAARPADQLSADVQAAMNVLARRRKRWWQEEYDDTKFLPTEVRVNGKSKDEFFKHYDVCVPPEMRGRGDAYGACVPPKLRDHDVLELRGLDLRGLILKNRDGDLTSGANFIGAKLDRVRLDGGTTNLRGARLEHAILHEANLRDAKLTLAYLYGTDLGGADIAGADFSGAKGLTAEEVVRAKNYECAKFDDKLRKGVEAIHGGALVCAGSKGSVSEEAGRTESRRRE
jgi:hypothetical protein